MLSEGNLGLDAKTITELPIESLAFVVLKNYAAASSWNYRNWLIGAKSALGPGPHMQALAEAWSWLEARVLVAPDPDGNSPDARIITRAGNRAIEQLSLNEIIAAERIGLDLHSRLEGKVRPIFLLGDYETAAFKAMKEVEVRVRELSKLPDESIGVRLMRSAFDVDNGSLTNSTYERGERQARSDLFAGAIGSFKNPTSHRTVTYAEATIQRAARVSSGKLVNTEQRIKAALRDSGVIGVDETGLRVAGSGGCVHVSRTEALTHDAYDDRRGKAAMDETGILPQFTGTLVRDGFSSYQWYGRCRHSLCNVHLLRDLVFVAELSPEQKVWTEPLAKLLLKMKDAVAEAKDAHQAGLSEQIKNDFLQRYDQLVKRADRLNQPEPKTEVAAHATQHQPVQQPTPRRLINRLQRKRDEVLRFISDLSVPFDNNGAERDLRMVKLRQKISGCFRTPDGARVFCRVRSYLSTARKQGYSLLCSLERALNGKPLVFQSSANQSNLSPPAT